ncbi:MAG: NAD(P)-dependent alcohol dehydrogenase [Deltaproteobacteria bacterium]|jgi:aryl-alcohol dehydrogenase|nr:NAD(P)-dependent alcohol dehydrogenase [Deltaproteobacteria bacterium]
MKIKAAVCRAPHAPQSFEELELEEPRANEIVVKIKSCGVCHTDMGMRDQVYPVPQPIVLGHEGAGFVEKVGSGVTTVAPGDPVLLTINSCGKCPACLNGKYGLCHLFWSLNFAGSRLDGTSPLSKGGEMIHGNFFGQSSFATYAMANERNVLKLDTTEDMDYLGPLGCGVMTGAGAVINVFKVRPGDSIVAFGMGTVALSAIMGARVCGATTIVAVGRNDKKLATAKEVGATHTINSTKVPDVVKAIKDLTNGRGVNYAVDTTAVQSIMTRSVECLENGGKAVILGASGQGTRVDLDAVDFMNCGKTILGAIEGNCVPQEFLPRLITLYRQGRFPLDKIVTFYPFDKLNEAMEDGENGRVIKAVVKM